MNRFQKLSFISIEEFFDYLPHNELIIAQQLRTIALQSMPNPTEKLAYNVPFYYQHSRVCFIWPSSVLWGKVEKGGVLLGFPKGHLLRDEIGWLEAGSRKEVRSKTFFKSEEIDAAMVRSYIQEALRVDMKTK